MYIGRGFADCHSVLEPNGHLRATLPPQSPIFPAIKLLHPPCHVVAVEPRGSQWINVIVAASDNFFIQQMTVQVQYDINPEVGKDCMLRNTQRMSHFGCALPV